MTQPSPVEEQSIEPTLDTCLHQLRLQMSIGNELSDFYILIEEHRRNRLDPSIGRFVLSHLDDRPRTVIENKTKRILIYRLECITPARVVFPTSDTGQNRTTAIRGSGVKNHHRSIPITRRSRPMGSPMNRGDEILSSIGRPPIGRALRASDDNPTGRPSTSPSPAITQRSSTQMQSVGTMCDDNPNGTLGKGFFSRFQHSIPVSWPDIIRPHITQFHSPNASHRAQFRNRIEQLVWLETCSHSTSRIIDFGSDRPTRVEQVNEGQSLVLGSGRGRIVLGHLHFIEHLDRLQI